MEESRDVDIEAPPANIIRLCTDKLTLQFKHLSYTVSQKGKPKEVLHSISGQILPGHLTAILGPSGAGKSSLLNVLAGFKSKGVQGSVLINGAERDMTRFRAQACYITQDSPLLPQLTAKETLGFASRLKLTTSAASQSRAVSEIMDLLGLNKCKDTRVSQLSGGERKRLSIGVELVTNPPIMFFDEPTSGLDTVSSAQVVSHLSNLAASGHAVVCVVHQPSSQLCELFDDLIVLAEGNILYCGPMMGMVPVFEEAGFLCPQYYNRADFALEVASGSRGTDLGALIKQAKLSDDDFDICLDPSLATEETVMLPIKKTQKNGINGYEEVTCKPVAKNKNKKTSQYPIGFFRQLWILYQRSMLCNIKDMYLTHIRLLCHVLVGVLAGFIYYDIGNEANKINSNIAFVFFSIMFCFYMNALPVVLTYPSELAVVIQENLNNWYSVTAYFFSSQLALLPAQLICPTIFVSISYYMTGQPMEITRIGWMLLIMILLVSLGHGIALILGTLVEPRLSMIGIPVLTIPILLFSGFFLRIPDIPVYLRWMGHISYYRHAFEALTTTLYGHHRRPLKCSDPYCHFKSPTKFLEHLDMHEELFPLNLSALLVWMVFLYVALYLCLRWKVHRAKN